MQFSSLLSILLAQTDTQTDTVTDTRTSIKDFFTPPTERSRLQCLRHQLLVQFVLGYTRDAAIAFAFSNAFYPRALRERVKFSLTIHRRKFKRKELSYVNYDQKERSEE